MAGRTIVKKDVSKGWGSEGIRANRITVSPRMFLAVGKGEKGWTGFRLVWGEHKTVRLVACRQRHVATLLLASTYTFVPDVYKSQFYVPSPSVHMCLF